MVYLTAKLRGVFLWGGLWVSFPTKSRPQLWEEHRPTPHPPTSLTAMTIKWIKERYSLSRIWITVMNCTVCTCFNYIFGWDHNFFCWTCTSSFKCPKFIPSFTGGGTSGFKRSFFTINTSWLPPRSQLRTSGKLLLNIIERFLENISLTKRGIKMSCKQRNILANL